MTRGLACHYLAAANERSAQWRQQQEACLKARGALFPRLFGRH